MSNPNPPAQPDTQQIQQAISETAKPQQGVPLEVHLPTGEVFKGTTPQEMLDKLVASKTEATRTIQAERARIQQLEEELRQARTPPPDADADARRQLALQYYETWAKDPTEATKIQMSQLLGVPAEQVADVLKAAVSNSSVRGATEEFIARYPDFPQSPQTAEMMKQALRDRFGEGLHVATADNLELVYNDLRRQGKITPSAMVPTATMNASTPPPNLRGAGAAPNPVNDVLAQFQNMSVDDMKKTLDRLYAQGVR